MRTRITCTMRCNYAQKESESKGPRFTDPMIVGGNKYALTFESMLAALKKGGIQVT